MLPHAVPPSHLLDTSAAALGYSHLLNTAADEDPSTSSYLWLTLINAHNYTLPKKLPWVHLTHNHICDVMYCQYGWSEQWWPRRILKTPPKSYLECSYCTTNRQCTMAIMAASSCNFPECCKSLTQNILPSVVIWVLTSDVPPSCTGSSCPGEHSTCKHPHVKWGMIGFRYCSGNWLVVLHISIPLAHILDYYPTMLILLYAHFNLVWTIGLLYRKNCNNTLWRETMSLSDLQVHSIVLFIVHPNMSYYVLISEQG